MWAVASDTESRGSTPTIRVHLELAAFLGHCQGLNRQGEKETKKRGSVTNSDTNSERRGRNQVEMVVEARCKALL